MKKALCLVLAVCLGAALDRMLSGIPATAAAGGGQGGGVTKCSSENGDVNADGKVDLSDAVTILGNLFLGNPTELVGLCVPPAAPSGLPATGQSLCYQFVEGVWTQVPCDSAICAGQDGSYAKGCPSEGRFTDNGDGTVTDHCTGLMWQKDTADVNADGKIDDADALPWCDATAYCENLSFGGGLVAWDDWRLPNVRELQSIVDYGRYNPSIDPVFGALSSVDWSSTSGADNPGLAWLVNFINGVVYGYGGKGFSYFVRAVRSGP